jgi:hypothetical protein
MSCISAKVYINEEIFNKPLFFMEDLPNPIEEVFKVCEDHDNLPNRETCQDAGLLGHLQCGICRVHREPRVNCGCVALYGSKNEITPLVRAWADGNVLEVEAERIIGLTLDIIPGLSNELDNFRWKMQGYETFCLVEDIVRKYFQTLVSWGCLYRDPSRCGGAWTYRRPR